jgi:hypothetical protein
MPFCHLFRALWVNVVRKVELFLQRFHTQDRVSNCSCRGKSHPDSSSSNQALLKPIS